MITITLTYRNRDLNIVNRCLDSLDKQNSKEFVVKVINYGSTDEYEQELNELVQQYSFIHLINIPTSGQLWCKSRAINIALKQCETPYFFVGDIDMIYHPDFVKTLIDLKSKEIVTYFQVGFLSKEENIINKDFDDYIISFKSSYGATGMTFFNTNLLVSINGYDEFYNGWGSEDTDVHVRLKNAGYTVNYFDDQILMVHQWHPKTYRTINSLNPFNSQLEKINEEYLKITEKTKKTSVNLKFDYGLFNQSEYNALNKIDKTFTITNKSVEVKALLYGVLLNQRDEVISVNIRPHKEYKSFKQMVKKILGKKTMHFFDMELINNTILETIISSLRNCPYKYQYNQTKKTINLVIKL